MKKMYNFETMFTSLKNEILNYCKQNKIQAEASKAGAYYHINFLLSQKQVKKINSFIENKTITELKSI